MHENVERKTEAPSTKWSVRVRQASAKDDVRCCTCSERGPGHECPWKYVFRVVGAPNHSASDAVRAAVAGAVRRGIGLVTDPSLQVSPDTVVNVHVIVVTPIAGKRHLWTWRAEVRNRRSGRFLCWAAGEVEQLEVML